MGNRIFSKQQTATAIAILFHAVGLTGILIFKSDWIIRSTAFNLLLSVALLFWVQEDKNIFFWLFALATMLTGIAVEIIGVNTGLLFGNYAYGDVLGIKWKQVPVIIGVNWFIVIFCSGIAITALLKKITRPINDTAAEPSPVIKAISVVTDGATLAVAFDWLIEPVAIKLGYWKWEGNEVPGYNYVCWFVISLLLMLLFRISPFKKENKFAIHLFLIQGMFFLLLRTFLP
jgi:bisanhydrobacterioruberin hydratase